MICSACKLNKQSDNIQPWRTPWRTAGLEEAQARIKIAGRNVNSLRYTHDTTVMADSEEELKSLLMRLKESEKASLKLNIKKKK